MNIIPLEQIQKKIYIFRCQKVMLDVDLADLYGVGTRVLNQAIKRHPRKFPVDFSFRLTPEETRQWQSSRSQPVILKRGQNIKYCPLVFTEHGALMAANILRSPKADEMSVFVVRAFIKIREILESHHELSQKLAELEKKYDSQFKTVFNAIRALMVKPVRPPLRIKGFQQHGVLP